MPDDVIELIKDDHKKFRDWCDQLESAEDDDKPAIYRSLAELLVPHSEAEEHVVYPAIEDAAPSQGEEVDDGTAEHHHIETMMKDLLDKGPDAPGADGIEAAMIAELRHHLDEEEEDVLPAYEKKSSKAQRAEVGAKFVEAKESARSIV